MMDKILSKICNHYLDNVTTTDTSAFSSYYLSVCVSEYEMKREILSTDFTDG